jgi:N-acetylglucosamine kinase
MFKIGFDGGGTSSRAAVIQHDAANGTIEVLGRGAAGSSNHYSVGAEGARQNLKAAMDAALAEANVLREQVEGFGFGLAGACSEKEKSDLRAVLAPLCGSTPFVVEEDAPAAQAGAFAGGPGAICIAGTGANCFGVNAQGEIGRADGLGPLLGDRGAGYRLGEAALRAICAAHDGAAPSTTLFAPCLAKLEVASVDELVQLVYRPDFTRDRIAALFPIVLQEAEAGDAVARELLEDSGYELAQTTRAVLEKLQIKSVALLGGVFENAAPVRAAFARHLREAISEVEIVTPRYDAAVGAALLLK